MLELKITSYNKLKIAITMKNLSGQSRKPKKGLQKDSRRIANGCQKDSRRTKLMIYPFAVCLPSVSHPFAIIVLNRVVYYK